MRIDVCSQAAALRLASDAAEKTALLSITSKGEPDVGFADNPNIVSILHLKFNDLSEECDEEGNALLTQRNKFFRGDELELLLPGRAPVSFRAGQIFGPEGEKIEDTRRAMMEFHLKLPACAPKGAIVRKNRVFT